MSVIGHDLRGPVASFQQLTPVLRQLVPTGPGTAEAQRLLDSLAAGARHLGELLDNLLRWARTEDGQTPNYPTYLPAADLASAATELLQPLALSKQIGLRLHVAPPHLQVFADPDLLATVLRNLVANAIKFTPTGGQVTVSIDAATTGTVRITVTDTGIGIAPERIRNLLAIAGHDSTRGTAGELGTGLGLPLSARFVRLIGGELRLTSQPGQGTEAAFELPAPPPRFGA
jgi:signal transduction histidine kinase